MSVVPMTKIRIYAHQEEKETLYALLQKKGLVQLEMPEQALLQDAPLCHSADAAVTVERQLASVKTALEVIAELDQTKKPLFAPRRQVTRKEMEHIERSVSERMEAAARINGLAREIAECKASAARLRAQMLNYEPWSSLDIPMNFSATKSAAVFTGVIPSSISFEEFQTETEQKFALSYMEKIHQGTEQTAIVFICPLSEREEAADTLRKAGFAKPSFLLPAHTAAREMEILGGELARHEGEAAQKTEALRSFCANKQQLQELYDYYMIEKERQEAKARTLFTKSAFVLAGYTPEAAADGLKKELESSFCCYVQITSPDAEEPLPVLFQNNGFVRPVEPVTEMFSLPSRGDIDPNPVMAVFYYVFFGLMLSDAGYGVVLAVATTVILKKFKPEGTLEKMLKLFFGGGISSIFWGAAFGGWFGDIIPAVSKQFFGTTMGPLGFYDPIKNPIPLLALSFAFGIIHLYTAMGVKFYTLTKSGKFKDAVYDVGFWYLLLTGLIMLVPIAPLGTAAVAAAGKLMAIGGALGLLFTQGRDSKNWIIRFFLGLYSLYDITSYLSDVLSYSRLLALGLATGVIAMVVNTMGSLGGNGIFGAVLMVVVFVLGHAMNLSINVLGTYVHTNRLHYVEFFKKFYDGGGKAFTPFQFTTKYIKIKEE